MHMPEGPEVDTDRLHEAIHEELEHEGSTLNKQIALTTAIFAAFAAVASLLAGSTINEALVLKSESTRLQGQASDQWAYYQAKGIKAAIASASSAALSAAKSSASAIASADVERYTAQQRTIAAEAVRLERARDHRSAEAEHLLHRHHGFANAVALFQVAIALGAVTALTRSRPVYVASLLLGVAGAGFYLWQFL